MGHMPASSARLVLVACLAVLALPVASGLRFHFTESQRERCFLQDVLEDTLVVGQFSSPDIAEHNAEAEGKPWAIFVRVSDPSDALLLERAVASEEVKFAFRSDAAGEHRVCVRTNATELDPPGLPASFELNAGESAMDFAEVARVEHLDRVEVELRRLHAMVRDVLREQQFQRSREEEFRAASEGINNQVVIWSIVQTIVILGSGLVQIRYLKKYFEKKKLV